ncbi:hypothetical protein EE612_026120, partial [Oryza sativa]
AERGRGRGRRHHGDGEGSHGAPHPPRVVAGGGVPAVPQRRQDRRLRLLPPVHRLPQVFGGQPRQEQVPAAVRRL